MKTRFSQAACAVKAQAACRAGSIPNGSVNGMKFKLSDHAEKRIRQRKIKLECIAAAIENPDKIKNDAEDHTLAHALKAIPERGSKSLRVIFNETTEPATIVTAYFE